jgi:hypothetical protein
MSRSYFYVYCIQISHYPTVLAVNYATDINRAFTKFRHAHPQIKDSVLRPDLYQNIPASKSARQALSRARELIRDLEAQGFEVIAGPPLYTNEYRCYVIEINGNENHVYVGQTNYPIDKRFQQHVYKYHSARVLSRYDILTLREDLCAHLPPSYNQADSLAAEKALYQDLKRRGFKVEGGT